MRPLSFVDTLSIALACAALAVAMTSCGRTGLRLIDPCDDEGEERVCSDDCGSGTQVCEQGTWSDCEVPVTTRACQNDCGSGTQSCEAGSWQACEVPVAERACTGTCGQGKQQCTLGRWDACEIPPVDFPCDNPCGEGFQHCEDGRLGRCEVPIVERDCMSGCGSGHESCIEGSWQACDAPLPNPPTLKAVLRDFSPKTHPDFERNTGRPGDDREIVKELLGPDDKPEYSGAASIHTVTSKESFDLWYRDDPAINARIDYDLSLQPSLARPGFFVYDDQQFFPLDGDSRGFGNEGNAHDFHFTLEASLTFKYAGGEVFSFRGDDDMWVFINRHLAINLGGLHRPESASVELDEHAAQLEITLGQVYPIHIFFAERHTYESTFTLETSVADQGSCPQ